MEESAKTIVTAEKEDVPGPLNRLLKWAAYPAAGASGFWVAEQEVNDAVYHNLKRYGAFNDLLEKMQPENHGNVAKRVSGKIEKEEFLAKSALTKTTYSDAVTERMEHMGLGHKLSDFPAKWRYIGRVGKREAVTAGMTAACIAIGALLTIANSKSILDWISNGDKKDEGKTR